MANYLIGFECLGCGKQFPPAYDNYICDECSQNLDALYDYKEIGDVFNTEALTPMELGICLALSTVVFWAAEIEKWFLRRRARVRA